MASPLSGVEGEEGRAEWATLLWSSIIILKVWRDPHHYQTLFTHPAGLFQNYIYSKGLVVITLKIYLHAYCGK